MHWIAPPEQDTATHLDCFAETFLVKCTFGQTISRGETVKLAA